MSQEALQEFYKYALLPQFGIDNVEIVWNGHEEIGPDDDAHYFTADNQKYVLIFRDYGAFGEDEIKELVKLPNDSFEYVNPTSSTENPPTYRFSMPTPSQYAHNITGYFTLLKI